MFTAFFFGIRRALRSIKLLLSLFAFNLLFALPLTIPIFAAIQLSTVNRLNARYLLADQLDPMWVVDLLNNRLMNGSLINFSTETFIGLYVIAGLYLLFNMVVLGGVLAYYVKADERFSLRLFGAYSGAYIWRFIRLLLYSAFFYGLVLMAYGVARRLLTARLTNATELGNLPWYRLSLVVLLVLGLAWVNMVFDYARIYTIVNEERSMWRATLHGWIFSLRNCLTAFPLFLSLAGIGFVALVAFTWLRDTVIQNSMFAVGLATAVGHLAIVTKLWAKLALAASQVRFYQLRQPALASVSLETEFEFRAATSESLDPAVLARAETAYAETLAAVPTTAKLPKEFPTIRETP